MSACLRLGAFASHGGSNVQAIIQKIQKGYLKKTKLVLLIGNNSDAGAFHHASSAGIPCLHLSGKTHPDPQSLDFVMTRSLLDQKVDLVLLAGYMKRLGPEVLKAFQGRIVNIHPSLLPKYGGRGMFGIHPHEAVIAAKDVESGVTVHLVDEAYDTGPVLAQARLSVPEKATPQLLQSEVLKLEHQIYSTVIHIIACRFFDTPYTLDSMFEFHMDAVDNVVKAIRHART